ncbi:MAG: nicotinate phosphoribosyltransferase [Anaerolineae bacterium]
MKNEQDTQSIFGWVNNDNMAMLVDLYELTMADSYFRHKRNDAATFDLFVRRLPHGRAFLVSAGLPQALAYLQHLRFTEEALAYLRLIRCMTPGFIDYLRNFRFSGDVWALPEGEVYFPPEPVLRVTGPRIEVQIIETFLLNTFNSMSMWASKAARMTLAAEARGVIDMSPRRDHGADAAMKVARASYLAGISGTSNVLAGQLFGIPTYGTMAHAYVMSFDDELTAFRAFAKDCPGNVLLLIDTYDVMAGVENAIIVGKEMAARGETLRGVRIDSGDLVGLSKAVRAKLDAAGLQHVRILLSGDLDEYLMGDLLAQGAAVDLFGVGTNLGTSPDDPSLGGVYKLVEDEAGPRAKLSTGKATLPGCKQVWRRSHADGAFVGDVIALADEPPIAGAEPLLVQWMATGKMLRKAPTLEESRAYCQGRLARLPADVRRIRDYGAYPVEITPALAHVRDQAYADLAHEK